MRSIKTLAEFLRTKFEGVTVLEQFPDPKTELSLPALSIVEVGTPAYVNLMPVYKGRTEDGLSIYMVGQYDQRLQLDLWSDYKTRRDELFENLFDIFQSEFIEKGLSAGLSLQLKDYYSAIARYDIVGYTVIDTELTSQTEEWRVKVDVLVNYPKMITKTESLITEGTIKTDIGDKTNLDNYDINETIEVF